MDLRKFILCMSVVVAILLFASGTVRLAYTNNYTPEEEKSTPENTLNDIIKPFTTERDPVNILVLGGDAVAGNTDTIMLINYNPSTAKLNLLSVPRDTKVHVKDSSIPKVNSAFPVGGSKLAVGTVGNLLGVKIKYCVFIDIKGFRDIIDLIGGVDYYIPVDMDYEDPTQDLSIHLSKGQQRLDGEKAEQFMRFRQPLEYTNEIMQYYDGSDLKRIDAQQNFIKELIRQKLNIYTLPKINSIIGTAINSVQTNLTLTEALKLAVNISKLSQETIDMFKVPGEATEEETGWYYIMDRVKTADIVKKYFSSGSEKIITSPRTGNKKNNSANENVIINTVILRTKVL